MSVNILSLMSFFIYFYFYIAKLKVQKNKQEI